MSKGTLDDVFFALSGSTRREILARLAEGGATVQEIADPFEVSLNTVSKHIKILERAGLVEREVRGREHHCSLRAEPLADIEVEPDRRLIFSWISSRTDEEETEVTVEITSVAEGAEVRLVHDALPTSEAAAEHAAGWENILARLGDYMGS